MRPLLTLFTFLLFSFHLQAYNNELTVIRKITVNGNVYFVDTSKKRVELKALEDDLEFEFKDTADAEFNYILRNYDKSLKTTRYSTTRYTNLKGGEYIFTVHEKSNPSKSDEIKVVVEATLSEEPWFYPSLGFFILLIIGSVYYFWSINSYRQKLQVLNIRNKIAGDLHDEVGSNLSSISVLLNSLNRKISKIQPELKPQIDDICQTSNETILNLRDTVWMISPDNDSIEKTFEKMRSFALKVFEPQNIDLDYKNNLDPKKVLTVSMGQRYNVYMIYRETINNIVKHAKATAVSILIEPQKDGLSIEIKDNGVGFDTTLKYEGNGLLNYVKRAKDCFIELTIESVVQQEAGPQGGTTLKMIIPEL